MAHNQRFIDAPPSAVWALLCDPRRYASFVPGSRTVRAFSPTWPSVRAELHHSLGAGVTVIKDKSTVVEVEPQRRLLLCAGMGPLGASDVLFELEPEGGGTRLHIKEKGTKGLMGMSWAKPLDLMMHARNAELLRRLERECLHRAQVMAGAGDASEPEGARPA